MRLPRLLAVVLVAATTVSAPAARVNPQTAGVAQQSVTPFPAGIERVTSVEGITEYRLTNGLRVLLFPDQSKPTTTVTITYLVGSRHENYGETGMAHLLEHMLMKGTPRHPNIHQEITQHGMSPRASTNFDWTNYFETFPAADVNLAWALDLESDRMINSYIRRKDLDSEFSVVRNELEQWENDPYNFTEKAFAVAFQWHNYGHWVLGARSDIENVPIDRLQAFYQLYYQPDNAVLMVAGTFDEATTLNLIAKYFSPVPRPARKLPQFYTIEPTQDGERAVTMRRIGDIQLAVALYHAPAGSHPDFAPLDILSHILGDNAPSGRLFKTLVETKTATSVDYWRYQLRDPGIVGFSAEVPKETVFGPARDGLLQVVEGFAENPPTKEEVARARTYRLKAIDEVLNSSENIGPSLSRWIGMGDWRLLFLHRDRLKKVTPEDVRRVAAKYLKPANRTLALFVPTAQPDRADIPESLDVAAMLKDYKGEALVAAGEAFDPSPANIESRTIRNISGAFKVALLPKRTRGNGVFATMTLRFGDENSLTNRSAAAGMAGGMLMRGTAKHTRQQIQDEFDALKARVSIDAAPSQSHVSIQTIRQNLPAVLRLVAEIVREPSFPAQEFDRLKRERISDIESQRSEPAEIALLALRRHLNPFPKGDVRYVASLDETIADLKATTLDATKTFHSDFYGASHGQLAVVGDFDRKEIAALAGELFGNWKSRLPFARIEGKYNDVAPMQQAFETPDKANAFFVAGMNLRLGEDDPDYPAMILGNSMLGGGLPDTFRASRLDTRLRQKEGYSYHLGSQVEASVLDQSGSFMVIANYAPQNVARLEAAFKEEIALALKEGFTAEEVSAAKLGYLRSKQVSRAQDAGLSRMLASYLFLGRTFAWDAEFEKKIAALTPEQISVAMRRHIDPSKFTIVKAGDFAKTPPK